MRGPFPLDKSRIDLLIIKGKPGVFGVSNNQKSIEYLGRSDFDLKATLSHYIGKYKLFWFEYAISQDDAIKKFAYYSKKY